MSEHERSLGGLGDLNIPFYKANATDLAPDGGEDVLVAGGAVVLAGTIPHPVGGRPHPILVFRFARPTGGFYPSTAVVIEEKELQDFKKLVSEAIDAALEAARQQRGENGS